MHTLFYFFFFNDTATTEIYTLSLHDALPICRLIMQDLVPEAGPFENQFPGKENRDRKSTRLNSSHDQISYAVFCLKKKKAKHVVVDSRYICCTSVRRLLTDMYDDLSTD